MSKLYVVCETIGQTSSLKGGTKMGTMGDAGLGFGAVVGVCTVILGCIGAGLWGCPNYAVYQQRLTGEAELARAQQNRQIAVNEAQAKKDAATLLADAEVLRADGVNRANHIIAQGLGGPEGYLRYLWIQTLEHNRGQIIYVPTETNLPILEAGRLAQPAQVQGPAQ